MPRLTPLAARKVIKKLERAGFIFARQRGSHISMKNKAGVIVVIPDHGAKEIPIGTLHEIITKQAKLRVEAFLKL